MVNSLPYYNARVGGSNPPISSSEIKASGKLPGGLCGF